MNITISFEVVTSTIFSSALIAMLFTKLRKLYNENALREDFKDTLYLAMGYAGEGPIVKGLEAVEPKIKNKKLRKIVRREIISEKINGRPSGEALEMLGIDAEDFSHIDLFIGREIEKVKEKASQVEPLLQRDATINMFISTIAPSFVILAFIGSSILSTPSIIFLSFMLLSILPVLYAISLTLSQRRLINAFKN
ncbi:MAG: hypothetical protein ACP5RK_00510 [Candidatus Micrarchaeia archaeon]